MQIFNFPYKSTIIQYHYILINITIFIIKFNFIILSRVTFFFFFSLVEIKLLFNYYSCNSCVHKTIK